VPLYKAAEDASEACAGYASAMHFRRAVGPWVWEVYPISCPCQNNTEILDVLRLSICISKYRRFSAMAAAQP
jgi:hypothetical protein